MSKQSAIIKKPVSTQRLDKWLWYARVTKTRTLASTLVQDGKVRVNRDKTGKPGFMVKVNDVITVTVHGRVRVLKVLAPGMRRGPACEAAELYQDLTPVDDSPSHGDGFSEPWQRKGERPTKRDRRALDRLRNSVFE